jgi:hypothetical protein
MMLGVCTNNNKMVCSTPISNMVHSSESEARSVV